MLLLATLSTHVVHGAVPPPDLRCISLDSNDNAILSWIIPPDPNNEFLNYNIYVSPDNVNFNNIATIATYNQNTTTINGLFAGVVYFYIETVYDDGSGPTASAGSDTLRPIIVLVDNSIPGQATINWNPIKTPDNPSLGGFYRIFRRVGSTGPWMLIDSVNNANFTYTEPVEFCTDTLFYRVEIDDDLPCTCVSNVGQALFVKQPPNSPVINFVTVDTASGNVTINWTPDPNDLDIGGYIIVREVNGVSTFDTIFGINNLTFVDTGGYGNLPNQIYGVAAFDTCFNTLSNFFNTSPTNIKHNTLHLDVESTTCDLQYVLNWNLPDVWPVGIADPGEIEVYFRKDFGPVTLLETLPATDSTYVHDDLRLNSTYCYYLRMTEANGGTLTSTSNQVCATLTGPTPPTILYLNYVTVERNGDVEVSCLVDTAAAVSRYRLARSVNQRGGYIPVAFIEPSNDTIIKFIDPTAKSANHSYFYRVEVLDICGNVTATSNISKSIFLDAKGISEDFINELNWNRYYNWDTLGSGVSIYNVYRSINGVYETTPIYSTFGDTVFDDNVLTFTQSDGKFCYYVEAIEGLGNALNFVDTSYSNEICVLHRSRVYLPNAFTPDGFGENEVFIPVTRNVQPRDYSFIIYNRHGKQVFESNDLNLGWDGGTERVGVYVYQLQFVTSAGETVEKVGHVTLIR